MKNGQETSRRAARVAETLIMLACCAAHFTLEVKAAPVDSRTEIVQYLSQYGYLPSVDQRGQADISEQALSEAISDFQSFAGLDVTGKIDIETAHVMTLPRCGVKDHVGPRTGGRTKRYILQGSKWGKYSLTYNISKYSTKLDRKIVDKEIARAFAVWSQYTDLKFSPKSGEVDIEIRFERGKHGDEAPFEGSSGQALAHGFFPEFGGDVHFNDDKDWTVNSKRGYNLFEIAVHEFGHALGLRHSNVASSVMAAGHPKYDPNFKLTSDDIKGIQAIYGPKTTEEVL